MKSPIQVVIDIKNSSRINLGNVAIRDTTNIEITLIDNSIPVKFTSPVFELHIKKYDGNFIRQKDGIEFVDNKVSIKLWDQANVYPGIVYCELLIKDGGRSTTSKFYFVCKKTLDSEIIESIRDVETLDNLDSWLEQSNLELEKFKLYVETLTNNNVDLESLVEIKDFMSINLEALKFQNIKASKNNEILIVKNNEAEEKIIELDKRDLSLVEIKEENIKASINTTNLDRENTEATTNISNLDSKNNAATNNVKNLDSKNTLASTNIKDLDSKNSTAADNITKLATKNTDAATNLENLNVSIEEAKEIKIATDEIIASGSAVTVTKFKEEIDKTNTQLEDNVQQLKNSISSFDKNLIEIKERLFDTSLKNRQLIFVGDSLREANGRWVFKKMAYKLLKFGIEPCLIGKSGLKAEHWSKTNITQNLNNFPTTDDVIKSIKGDGSECVIDICLCTNDLVKTEAEVVGYLKKGISDILIAKPNVKFILTTPNKYKTVANNPKAYNIIKTVVNDLGSVAFSDVQNNVFREGEDITPYMIDDVHPNKLGQSKIAEYKIKELFDGCETVTHDIKFNVLNFTNSDGSKTVIRYAIFYNNTAKLPLYLKKDYENKWCFTTIVSSTWVYLSELIGTSDFNILMQRFNSTGSSLYGIIEIDNIEGLINFATSTQLVISSGDYSATTKINVPLIQTESTIYDILNNIKFWDLNGNMDSADTLYKSLASVTLKTGFYQTDGGANPTSVYMKRVSENEFLLCEENSNAICKQLNIYFDGIYDLQAITWGTIRATGKLKIKNFAKLREALIIGTRVKILNSQHYSPIVQKSIIELLDY